MLATAQQVNYCETRCDRLDGGPNDDKLYGRLGNDALVGGHGRDLLSGGFGRDFIYAVDGSQDTVVCGPGRDRAVVDEEDIVRRCESVAVREFDDQTVLGVK
jgi:hypothetical protein